MIWSIAWKNVWRNKRRSVVVITAVTLGTIAGVFTAGLMQGWLEQKVNSTIYTEESHIKINNPNYLINEESIYTIDSITEIENYLSTSPEVQSYAKRLKVVAMGATSKGNTAFTLNGVSVENEMKVSDIYKKIVEGGGSYLSNENKNQIVISDKTAGLLKLKNFIITGKTIEKIKRAGAKNILIEKLNPLLEVRFDNEKKFKAALEKAISAEDLRKYGQLLLKNAMNYRIGSKIVFTFTDKNNEIIALSLRVCGVYKTSNTSFDAMNAFMDINELAKLSGFNNNQFHEVAIILKNNTDINLFRGSLKSHFPAISALTWKELSPDAGMTGDFIGIYNYFIMGIILFALAFGIINTMLMSVLERIKEIGMLMAIGMNRTRIFKMIMFETIFLTIVGAIGGMTIGGAIIAITHRTGLNFTSFGEGLEAMGWSSIVYPNIDLVFFIGITLMVVATGIISSIIPARKALKLNPIEALRTE